LELWRLVGRGWRKMVMVIDILAEMVWIKMVRKNCVRI
jgi:hypothetical protein